MSVNGRHNYNRIWGPERQQPVLASVPGVTAPPAPTLGYGHDPATKSVAVVFAAGGRIIQVVAMPVAGARKYFQGGLDVCDQVDPPVMCDEVADEVRGEHDPESGI